MKGLKAKTQDIVYQYTELHLTCEQIGRIHGCSRGYISQLLKLTGVSSAQGERVQVDCAYCGDTFSLVRSLWRKSRKHYCSQDHYFASLVNPDYIPWRQGQRIARAIVSQYFDLQPENIVHHWDSDNRNNDLTNLAAFRDQAHHMAWERGNKDHLPIWNGRLVQRKS